MKTDIPNQRGWNKLGKQTLSREEGGINVQSKAQSVQWERMLMSDANVLHHALVADLDREEVAAPITFLFTYL